MALSASGTMHMGKITWHAERSACVGRTEVESTFSGFAVHGGQQNPPNDSVYIRTHARTPASPPTFTGVQGGIPLHVRHVAEGHVEQQRGSGSQGSPVWHAGRGQRRGSILGRHHQGGLPAGGQPRPSAHSPIPRGARWGSDCMFNCVPLFWEPSKRPSLGVLSSD